MIKHSLVLNLGGEDRRLVLNMGSLDHLETITGKDPLTYTAGGTDWKSMKEFVRNIIAVGMITSDQLEGKLTLTSQEDVEKWIAEDMEPADFYGVMMFYHNFMNPKALVPKEGKGKDDTQGEAANVAAI